MEEAIANPVKSDFEATNAAIDFRCILCQWRAFEIAVLNQVAVSWLQLLEAALERLLLTIEVPGTLRKLSRYKIFHFFAKHKAVA